MKQIKVNTYIDNYVPIDLRTKFLYWLQRWDESARYDSFYDKDVLDNCLKYANE